MNTKTIHRIIAFGSMAVVIGVGIAMFGTRSHPVDSASDSAVPPPPTAQTSDAVAPIPAAAVADARDDRASPADAVTPTVAPAAPEPALARPVAAVHRGTRNGGDVVATTGPAAAPSDVSTPESVADRVERLRSADVVASQLSVDTTPAADPSVGTGAVLTASDSQITTDVKTAIAGDVDVKDLNIGVSTTDGVVALTGSVASQGAIDEAKGVAGKVKDVKRVDTSALILASL